VFDTAFVVDVSHILAVNQFHPRSWFAAIFFEYPGKNSAKNTVSGLQIIKDRAIAYLRSWKVDKRKTSLAPNHGPSSDCL